MIRKYVGLSIATLIITIAVSVIVSPYKPAYADSLSPQNIPAPVANDIANYNNNCSSVPEKYKTNAWISAYQHPSQQSITVPYGTKDIALQLNLLDFICQDHVHGNSTSYPSPLPNDGSPYSVASSASVTNIDSGTATNGIITDASQLFDINRVISRTYDTRYWFDGYAPSFTYRANSPITTTQTINIDLTGYPYRNFDGGSSVCIANSTRTNADVPDGRNCDKNIYHLSMNIVVEPQWNITPVSAVKSITSNPVYPGSITKAGVGSTITWLHTVKNTSSTATDQDITSHYQNRVGSTSAFAEWQDVIVDSTGIGGLLRSGDQGRCLDADLGTLANNSVETKAQQWDCNAQPQQIWKYDSTAQTFRVAGNMNKCLNATGGGNGSPVTVLTCNDSIQQKWRIDQTGFIQSQAYIGMCMDVNGGANAQASYVYSCHPSVNDWSNNQYWQKGTIGIDSMRGSGFAAGDSFTYTSTYKVTAADVNRTLCRATSAVPSVHDGGWAESSAACVYIPYDFNLVPSVAPLNAVVEAGAPIPNVIPKINNTGTTLTDGPSNWQLTEMIVTPTGSITNATKDNNQTPCAWFGNSCTVKKSGSQVFSQGTTTLDILSGLTVPDVAAGTKICFALSVEPYTEGSTTWRHSAPVCMTVGKYPQVNVLGSDLISGRTFNGLTLPTSSANYGIVDASQSKRPAASTVISAPSTDFSKLWPTGVDDSSNKIAANKADSHWTLSGVTNDMGKKTCQAGPFPRAATTIVDTTTGAGYYTVTGSQPWTTRSPSARWIGQNQNGQNETTASCPDPTYNAPGSFETKIPQANTYVFKMTSGFTIASDVDPNSVVLTIHGAVDNDIEFRVNGVILKSPSSSAPDGEPAGSAWQRPGFGTAGSFVSVSSAATPGAFHTGSTPNVLEVLVKSTYSHTGILIDKMDISGTKTAPSDTTYGSWVEYGIFALPKVGSSSITGIASGSAFATGLVTTANPCQYNTLSFTNATAGISSASCSSTIGGYASTRSIPDIAATFSSGMAVPTNTINLDSNLTTTGAYFTATTSNITITGGTIAKSRWLVLNAPNANITIKNDINYTTDPLKSIQEIPQLVIIAKNIFITGNVSKVDAWLIAKGNSATDLTDGVVNTCSDVAAAGPITINDCNKQLIVNGPVMAQKLYLNRTAGSEVSSPATAAEAFNLRPDAYLWGYARATSSRQIQTVFSSELPPRF